MKKGIKILLIVLGIIIYTGALFGVFKMMTIKENTQIKEKDIEIKSDEISILDVELNSSNIDIKIGDELKVVTDNKYVKVKQTKEKLEVTEKSHSIFSIDKGEVVTIYIPKNHKFDKVNIEIEAGDANIERLLAKKIELDLGEGNTNIDRIDADESSEIELYTGDLTISSGTMYNLNLDASKGNVDITNKIKGKSEIEGSSGNINLKLINTSLKYKIKYESGVGTTKADGKKLNDGEIYGTGENIIKVESGSGKINIETK